MVYPSGRVPEWAPDWFFMATEACHIGTPDLGLFLGVSIFIGIFGIENKSGGVHEEPTRSEGVPGGRALPPPLWRPRGSSGPPTKLLVPILFKKIIKKFQLIWRTFISAQKATPR